MNNKLIGAISSEGEIEGLIEDKSLSITVQITESGPQGISGKDGCTPVKDIDYFDGKEIEIQKSSTHVQWRYAGEPSWTNLIPLSEIVGKDGESGVVIGTTLPTDPEVKVFIDVSGDPDPLATEQYVDDAISLALNSIINGNEVYY